MRVNVVTRSEFAYPADECCLVLPLYEKGFPFVSEILREEDELTLQALGDKETLTGKAKEVFLLPTPAAPYRNVLVAGLGGKEQCGSETVRRAAGNAAPLLQQSRIKHLLVEYAPHPEFPVTAFVEGVLLGQYDFDVYKKRKPDEPAPIKVEALTVIVDDAGDAAALSEAARITVLTCLSTNGARHLANTPPNEMTPASLAEFARGIAEESGCECVVLEPKQIASLGMNALMGVGRGSANTPRLIILRYHHSDSARTLAIVGKGITFDTGGISIKPGQNMHEMKYDMCGAAAVLCTMMNVVELKPAVNVLCVVPTAENMLDAESQRPGDIVEAYNGTTIEITNTDAEGRLVLADAMSYAIEKYRPDAMVDLATLTGACVVALGHIAAGLFSTHEPLSQALVSAGEESGERLWPMPLWEDYERLIDGNHGDVNNCGPREGGAITAAAFLKRFVGETPWAHIDIAGTAWGGKHQSYLDVKHATGFGVRLLTRWILDEAAKG